MAQVFEKPNIAKIANAKYRNPDALGSAYDELRKLIPGYQKVDGARRLGPKLDPKTNTSTSFRFLCAGIEGLFK